MNLTLLALMNLAISTCPAHYGAGLSALNWYRNTCTKQLYSCFEKAVTEQDASACIDKSNAAKICDPSGECL